MNHTYPPQSSRIRLYPAEGEQHREKPSVICAPSSSANAIVIAPQVEGEPTVEDTQKKKKTLAAFQLPKNAIPVDGGHIKEALWFHIQVFGGLIQKGATIGPTPPDLLNDFNKFFNRLEDVTTIYDTTSTSGSSLVSHHRIDIAQVNLSTLPSNSTVRVKQQFRRMESFMLGYMRAALACYGMRQWHPDLTQPSDSLFNVACRFVVVGTFRQALISRTYAAYGVPIKYADSYDLLSKIYDHIVHFHYATRFRKELETPGSVLTTTELQARLSRRARLSKARINWLLVNKYPSRYVALCQPAATSDDEVDPNDPTKRAYRIFKRPERSTEAECWVRRLEVKRIQDNKYRRGGARPYHRHIPTISIDSPIESLPHNMPIDYFDATFFNGLQYNTQQLCANPSVVAIPEDEKTWFTHSPDERLSDEIFTECYGAGILAKYEFVQTDEASMPMEVTNF